jgi:hypothetical protein
MRYRSLFLSFPCNFTGITRSSSALQNRVHSSCRLIHSHPCTRCLRTVADSPPFYHSQSDWLRSIALIYAAGISMQSCSCIPCCYSLPLPRLNTDLKSVSRSTVIFRQPPTRRHDVFLRHDCPSCAFLHTTTIAPAHAGFAPPSPSIAVPAPAAAFSPSHAQLEHPPTQNIDSNSAIVNDAAHPSPEELAMAASCMSPMAHRVPRTRNPTWYWCTECAAN